MDSNSELDWISEDEDAQFEGRGLNSEPDGQGSDINSDASEVEEENMPEVDFSDTSSEHTRVAPSCMNHLCKQKKKSEVNFCLVRVPRNPPHSVPPFIPFEHPSPPHERQVWLPPAFSQFIEAVKQQWFKTASIKTCCVPECLRLSGSQELDLGSECAGFENSERQRQ